MDANRTHVRAILDGFRVLVASLASASRMSELKLGVTGAQHFLMQQLMEGGEMSVNQLAERTHTHQSTVSTVVSKLVAKGLVNRVRSDADARVQLLSLTAQGRQKLRKGSNTIQDRLIRSIEKLPSSEQRALSTLLERVIEAAGLVTSKPSLFLEPAKQPRKGQKV